MDTYLMLLSALFYVALGQNDAKCGVPKIPPLLDPEDRIYGGSTAIPGSWPWQAGIYTHSYQHFCGGALINDRYVLTAAHCVWSKLSTTVRVHLGSHTRLATDDTEAVYKVDEVCVHPRYNPNKANIRDIAIVKLRDSVNFTNTISSVCLPNHMEELPEGSKFYVTGWGATTRTKKLFKSAELKQAMTEEERNKTACPYASQDVLCATHTYGSSCFGDSGGPVVHQRNGTWTVFGLVNGGPWTCGDASDSPLYFAKVSHYMDNFILPYMDPKTPRKVIRRICTIS